MIRRRNIDPGSALRGPVTALRIVAPRSDLGGIADFTPAAVGDRLPLNGSYCLNTSSDTFSCDLRLPVCPVVTSDAVARQWLLEIKGTNHVGQVVTETIGKTSGGSRITGASSVNAFTRIEYIKVLAASTIASRVRVGFCYAGLTINGGSDASRLDGNGSAGTDKCRRLALPFKPQSASDILAVNFVGARGFVGHIVNENPGVTNSATIVYSSTPNWLTATYSGTWTISGLNVGIGIGDVAITRDGWYGIVTAFTSGAAGNITVDKWFKNGVAATATYRPVDYTYGTNATADNPGPIITIVRPGVQGGYTAAFNGGLLINQPIGGITSALPASYQGFNMNNTGGYNAAGQTWGTVFDAYYEPKFDMEFEVLVKGGAIY
jgi:hypothetical protein